MKTALNSACKNVPADCVVDLARARADYRPDALQSACAGDTGNCIGRLASIRMEWNGMEWNGNLLKSSCENADADCVVDLVQKGKWEPEALNDVCKY